VWSHEEHNNVLEARAALMVLRHVARRPSGYKKRVLVFTDSLVTLGIFEKGRSSAPVFLHLCRRAVAVVVSSRMLVYWRYVPSELNYSDGPSKGEPPGVAKDTAAAHKERGISDRLLRFLPSPAAGLSAASTL